ncbi:hypothetical protein JCM30471_18030 [Desulfuromonas carbonis]
MNRPAFLLALGTVLLACCLTVLPLQAAEPAPDDAQALQGISAARGVFDISRSRPDTLLGALKLVAETREGLLHQGVKPDLVVLFRGPAVTLLTTDNKDLESDERKQLEAVGQLILSLQKDGVRFSVCSIATRIFKVDNQHLLPGLEPVGNVLISLMALQQKGYALVPLY